MVGHYMDTLLQSTGSRGVGATFGHPDSIAEAGEGESAAASGASKGKGKATAEKADTFNNFVRKNLKSGGSSKKLNRSTSRVSMAKQRWINRSGEQGGQKGGKYGSKYGRKGGFKYSGGGGGGGEGGDGGGGNSYSKPRGLQQWGLDSLEMSLDLIASVVEPPAAESQARAEPEQVDSDGVEDLGDEDGLEIVDGAGTEVVHAAKPSSYRVDPARVDRMQHTGVHAGASAPPPLPSAPPVMAAPVSAPRSSSAGSKPRAKPSAQDKIAAKVAARQRENERIQAMTALAPKCPGHSMVAKLLVVKKSGANKVVLLNSALSLLQKTFHWWDCGPIRHTSAGATELHALCPDLLPVVISFCRGNSSTAAPSPPSSDATSSCGLR
jgi:hypothetical protein